jgi:hypothetical protein
MMAARPVRPVDESSSEKRALVEFGNMRHLPPKPQHSQRAAFEIRGVDETLDSRFGRGVPSAGRLTSLDTEWLPVCACKAGNVNID